MCNDPQCLVAIREHTGGEVGPPNRQVGEGESGPVGMKSGPRFQELVMLEDHKGHWFLGIRGLRNQSGRRLRDARDEPFLRFGATYDDWVCCRSQGRREH